MFARSFDGVIGIHAHNDCDVAVANTLAAVENGATHVQGCLNGYGERCGNANLASVIANLELKAGQQTIGPEKLQLLTSTARYIAELANLPVPRGTAFVGQSAFAHKGGIHVSAVLKDSTTYEHISPELVGNHQRVLVSDLSGRSNIVYKLKRYDPQGLLDDDSRRKLLERIKDVEFAGYDLEAADGNFELFVLEALHPGQTFFDVESYEVVIRAEGSETTHTASVRVKTEDGEQSATATGNGPVNALDVCLRKCISALYPADRRRAPDRLQSPRPRFRQGHRRQGSRAGRMVGRRTKLVNRRRFRRRDRGQLGCVGQRAATRTDAARGQCRSGTAHTKLAATSVLPVPFQRASCG